MGVIITNIVFFYSDFEWSPDDNIISYWVPEVEANPARVTLLGIPSREELRVRNLFNVTGCKLHWQKSGEHLCVKVDRYQKKKIEDGEVKYTVSVYFVQDVAGCSNISKVDVVAT